MPHATPADPPVSRTDGDSPGAVFLADARFEFRRLRRLAENAISQVPTDKALHERPAPDGNSIAILVRHLAGNLRSRWTDFLFTDGEKPDRDRESEFEPREDFDRARLLAEWDRSFAVMEGAMAELGEEHLGRTVRIRGEAFRVQEAITRQIVHLAYHTGQIVLLARRAAPRWRSLSIPRGGAAWKAARYRSR